MKTTVDQYDGLSLIDQRMSVLDEAGAKALGDFLEGQCSIALWEVSIEARGELSVLRDRIARRLPLTLRDKAILENLGGRLSK